MQTGPVDGKFIDKDQPCGKQCPKCGHSDTTSRNWESSDGAYENVRFTCHHCGHVWWWEII